MLYVPLDGEGEKGVSITSTSPFFKMYEEAGAALPSVIAIGYNSFGIQESAYVWSWKNPDSEEEWEIINSDTCGVLANGLSKPMISGTEIVINAPTVKVADFIYEIKVTVTDDEGIPYEDFITIPTLFDGQEGPSGISPIVVTISNPCLTFSANADGETGSVQTESTRVEVY
jgi:hypothetical protein